MSEIHFSADLDSSKLEATIKQSNKTISDWSKDVEKAGGQVDQSFNKLGKSFKDTIREQKELIKSIEQDVKALQKAYDDAAAGRAKQAVGAELRSAKKALAEEQGILLGLQKQQIAANEKEAESQEGIIGKLKGWALGLVTVGAALKIAKGIIDSTEASATAFEKVIAGATSAVGYFFKAIASGDWTNFFSGLGNAVKGAVEFVDTMERLNNRLNEQQIKSSEIDIQIAELRDKTYDKDEANNEERKKALAEIVRLQEKKYKAEAKLAEETYNANLKRAASDSGLSEQQIKNFIKEYSSFEDLIEIGEKYNKLQRLMFMPGVTNMFLDELEKEVKLLGPGAAEAGKYVKQVGKITIETRKQLADFAVKANEAEAAFGQKNRRDKMQLAEVTNKINSEAEAAAKKAQEDTEKQADLNFQLVEQKKLLEKAVVSGNENEIKAIAAKIVLLQQELALRERLTTQAIGTAIIREATISKITGFKIPTLLPGGIKAPSTLAEVSPYDTGAGDYIPGTVMLSKQGWAKQKKDSDEYNKNAEESLKRQLELRNQIVNAAANLVYQIGQAVGLQDKELAQLDSYLNAFSQFASGDVVGGVMSMVSSVIMSFPSAAEKYANEIERLNGLLEEQQRLIELSERKGGKGTALAGVTDIAQQTLKENEEALAQAEYKLRHSRGGIFFSKRWKDVEELTQAVKESKIAVEEAQQAYDDFITGGITENTIADVIAQGFQEGKTSVDDFADYMNQVLIDAVMNVFTDTLLSSPKMKDYMEWLKGAMTGGITDAEKEENARRIAEIAAENKAAYEAMTSGLDMRGNIANIGMVGTLQRSITEETGTELAGLFRRFADDNRTTKDYTLAGLNHLVGIEKNTYGSWQELLIVNTKLDSVIANTRAQYTSPLS